MKITKNEKELHLAMSQFLKMIYVDFGISHFSDKIKNWYQLNWDEFLWELKKHRIKINETIAKDWEQYFYNNKARVRGLIEENGF